MAVHGIAQERAIARTDGALVSFLRMTQSLTHSLTQARTHSPRDQAGAVAQATSFCARLGPHTRVWDSWEVAPRSCYSDRSKAGSHASRPVFLWLRGCVSLCVPECDAERAQTQPDAEQSWSCGCGSIHVLTTTTHTLSVRQAGACKQTNAPH